MAEKKDPCRFTVMFNRADPNHLRVVEILNQQKHRKAQFIVNAVLHYLSCPETPTIQEATPVDKKAILEIVIHYLESRERDGARASSTNKHTSIQSRSMDKSISAHTAEAALDQAGTLLGEDGLAAIADTMNAFFRK